MIRVVILAAGKGKRMGSTDKPKVLQPLLERPLLSYVLEAVKASGVDDRPVVVVGFLAEQVKAVCGDICEYALQEKLQGTGDAVRVTRGLIEGSADHVLVLNGDQPLVTGAVIRKVADMHLATGATLTLGTVDVDDFKGPGATFADFGRIIRKADGSVGRIVEVKDASPAELASTEVNPSIFCFKASWLWPRLDALTTDNAQGEYYITALIAKAIADGEPVSTVPVEPREAIGVNTPEQLALAESILKR
jgi:bifunctional UDP-N-acetylglucosamine pyrophosphorylase/glucosamine-1-phosphate N-acetyltransferase